MGGPKSGYNMDLIFDKEGKRGYQKAKGVKVAKADKMLGHMMRQS